MTTTATTDRVLPHNLQAEEGVLGSLLVEGDRIFEVPPQLQPIDFYRLAHQQIYRVMREMAEARAHIDPLTVADRLTQRQQLDSVGGPVYLWKLTDGMPRGFNLDAAVDIILRHALRTQLIHAATKIQAEAYADDCTPDELLMRAERAILAIRDREVRGAFVTGLQLAQEGMAAVELLQDGKHGVTGLATGFHDLDDLTAGLQRGTLGLIAARPGMGKSAFALNLAQHAVTRGAVVGVFSLEMSLREVALRLVSADSGVDGHRIRAGFLRDIDYPKLSDAFCRMGESSLFVSDATTLTTFDVHGKARALQAQHGLDLLIIDYLQLMKLPRAENRNIAVAEVSRGLKLIARELDIPIVALSQLSRASEQRGGDHRPLLSDLRDSGALEQDADLVLFIHRPEVYAPNDPDLYGVAEVIVAKQRNGRTGTVELAWSKELTRFDDLAVR